ncbi:hypothetical protein HK102_006195 [Quaeritorhiza haematococci]|nr:hypothetical protein HK102_006195 [Quaeritorhiza haematococci]
MHALKALLALAILAVTGSLHSTLAAPTEAHSQLTPMPADLDNGASANASEGEIETHEAAEIDAAGPAYGRGFGYGHRGFKKGRFPHYSNVIHAPRHKK